MRFNLISDSFNSSDNIHAESLVKFYSKIKQNFTNDLIYASRMNDEAKNFSRNLKLLMEYHGDTQKKLERRSGVSQKTISNMLNPGDDTSPNLSNVALIANAYNLKTWHLLLPNATLEILINKSIEKLVDNYINIDKESQETVLRVTENSARFLLEPPKKIKENNN